MNSWIKFAIVFFSLFLDFSLLPYPGDSDEKYEQDFFLIETLLNKFELLEYNEYPYWNFSSYLFTEQNLIEWENFFEKKIESNAIQFWLYESKLSEIDELLFSLENK